MVQLYPNNLKQNKSLLLQEWFRSFISQQQMDMDPEGPVTAKPECVKMNTYCVQFASIEEDSNFLKKEYFEVEPHVPIIDYRYLIYKKMSKDVQLRYKSFGFKAHQGRSKFQRVKQHVKVCPICKQNDTRFLDQFSKILNKTIEIADALSVLEQMKISDDCSLKQSSISFLITPHLSKINRIFQQQKSPDLISKGVQIQLSQIRFGMFRYKYEVSNSFEPLKSYFLVKVRNYCDELSKYEYLQKNLQEHLKQMTDLLND